MNEHQAGIIRRHAGHIPTKEIARLCGVHPGTVRNWCSANGISLGMVFERDHVEDALIEVLYETMTCQQIADLLGWKYGKVRGRLLQLGITKGDYKK